MPERQLGPTVAISLMVRGPLEIFFLVPEGFQIFHLDSTCGHPDGPASGTGRPQGSRVGDVEEVDSPGRVALAQAPGAGLHGQHAPFACMARVGSQLQVLRTEFGCKGSSLTPSIVQARRPSHGVRGARSLIRPVPACRFLGRGWGDSDRLLRR